MAVIKLKPGETVIVAAVDPSLVIGGGPMPGGEAPVDPWYGIDLGLGYLRPDNTLPQPERPAPPVDPGYGVDEDTGWVHPDHELPVPLPPVDPAWGIDEDLGYLRPDNSLPVPPNQKPDGPSWEVKVAWTPTTGWVVVAIPTGAHPTPSKKR
jgi:hypothetical protein